MADIPLRHVFGGGWATDFGPQVDVGPDQSGSVSIPFLVDAENVIFTLDGGLRKKPGATKLNSSVLESGADIRGIFDAWFHGASGSPTQHRIVHVNTTIKEDDADGTFQNLFTGLSASSIPSYTMLEDLLIIAQSGTDVPKSWDGTTAQDLAGTPPNFSICTTHKNHVWAAGIDATPSRLHYSDSLNPEDWTGGVSGSIDIDPSDGDRITGIASHQNSLFVFKGPYKGSIHRITGSAPTGGDAFARTTFVEGVGAFNHNGIFKFGDDLGFIAADGTIRSLSATSAFGDFQEASLSLGINDWIDSNVNFTQLGKAWAVDDAFNSRVLITVPAFGATEPNYILCLDYRFQPARWTLWNDTAAISLASVIDPGDSNRRIIMAGGTDGFVRKYNQNTRSVDGTTAINYKVTTPFLTYGDAFQEKTISGFGIGIRPRNTGSFTFAWKGDSNMQKTHSVSQGGGASLGSFELGTDVLGGARFLDRFFDPDDAGHFRTVQYQATHAVNNEDLEIHRIGVRLQAGTVSLEN